MKKIIFLTLLVSSCLIQGCGVQGHWVKADVTPYPDIGTVNNVYVKNYKIGEKKTVFIGQDIIAVKKFSSSIKQKEKHYVTIQKDASIRFISNTFPISFSSQPIIISHDDVNMRIDANTKYESIGTLKFGSESQETNTGETFHIVPLLCDDWWKCGILISDDGSIYKKAIYSFLYQKLYSPQSITITPETPGNFQLSTQNDYSEPIGNPILSFELIYSGMNDVSLNTTYREYGGDLIRPAFSQNLTYKPNAKYIGFKDFVIQIQEVSNKQITYTVVEDGLHEDIKQ
jgi:hypothetical protein